MAGALSYKMWLVEKFKGVGITQIACEAVVVSLSISIRIHGIVVISIDLKYLKVTYNIMSGVLYDGEAFSHIGHLIHEDTVCSLP